MNGMSLKELRKHKKTQQEKIFLIFFYGFKK